jgi:hypothetical protein
MEILGACRRVAKKAVPLATFNGVKELLHCRPEDIIWEMEERDNPVDNLHVSRNSSSSIKAKAH